MKNESSNVFFFVLLLLAARLQRAFQLPCSQALRPFHSGDMAVRVRRGALSTAAALRAIVAASGACVCVVQSTSACRYAYEILGLTCACGATSYVIFK